MHRAIIKQRVLNSAKSASYAIRRLLIDRAPPEACYLLAGMGRSGTTWLGSLINHKREYRVVFEPFYPHKVDAAKAFSYLGYVSPSNCDTVKFRAAKEILSGNVTGRWIDKENPGICYRKRLIKDIRCNLMLGWLQLKFRIPTIFIIRDPVSVALSWMKLGWGHEANENRSDFEIITKQQNLLRDFPLISDFLDNYRDLNRAEELVATWCILNHVALAQIDTSLTVILFYEALVSSPVEESKKVFDFLGEEMDASSLERVSRLPSSTDYNSSRGARQASQISSAEQRANLYQSERIERFLAHFRLNGLYDERGKLKAEPSVLQRSVLSDIRDGMVY